MKRACFRARFALAIACALACGSCDQDIGSHDFMSSIGLDETKPGPVLYGWVQTKHGEPVFAICFVSTKTYFRGDLVETDNGRIKEIYGHRVRPSLSQKAIYSLQPDLTLKTLPLSAESTDRLLILLDRDAGIGRADVEEWKIFNAEMLPRLTTFTFPTSEDSTFRAVSNSNNR